ncbi:MAG: hypothetical protein GY842_04800, partial [bacterium]|nr:hypothetical protein [bacterium]
MDWKRRIGLLSAVLLCTSVVIATSAIAGDGPRALNGSASSATRMTAPADADSPDVSGQSPATLRMGQRPPKVAVDKSKRALYGNNTGTPFVYTHSGGARGLRATGDDCSDPYVIGDETALPYSANHTTTGFTEDYGCYTDCQGPSTVEDTVYSFTPTVVTIITVSLCNSPASGSAPDHDDTRLLIFDENGLGCGSCPAEDGDVLACNDDDPDECPNGPGGTDGRRMSTISGFRCEANTTYYFVVTSWDDGSVRGGDYTIDVGLADSGSCCHVVPQPDACSSGVFEDSCKGLADMFTANSGCPVPCQADPIDTQETCPEDVIWGPGDFSTGSYYISTAISDASPRDGEVPQHNFDAFWNLEDPIAALRVWGCYSNFAFDEACDKDGVVPFYVEFWSHDGGNEPGTLQYGPFEISGFLLETESEGVSFTECSDWYQVNITLPQAINMDTGWVTVYAGEAPGLLNQCFWRWPAAGEDAAESGDLLTWDDWAGQGPGDLPLCVSPPGAPGACCDQEVAPYACSNAVSAADCTPPKRWVQEDYTGQDTCARFDGFDLQQCGVGACCYADGSCLENDIDTCTNGGGEWNGGEFCAQTPHSPDGYHCAPVNDLCTDVSPGARGAFSETFTGRNDGTTADIPEVGTAAWEAFNNPNPCSDITIDFCSTDPAFTSQATSFLMPSCTGYDARIEATSASATDRESGDPLCCLDNPPGYDLNFVISFESIPSGDYWFPIRSGVGSTGGYTVHVTGDDCVIDDASEDCNNNGFHDVADVVSGTSEDCNGNLVPDECECGDYDDDGKTGLDDYALFQGCYSGPVTTVSGCDCTFFDNDLDSDVD